MTPLVSVVTPTWQRHDLLLGRCIPSVVAQSYPRVEHVVVSDGPDPELAELVADLGVTFAELDRHDEHARWGHWARLHGIGIARGDLIAYLDDDNAYHPDHLSRLAGVLAGDPGLDFAYSRMDVYRGGRLAFQVGAQPPVLGQIDTSLLLHRRGVLELGTWEQSLPTIDWDLVDRWLRAGARWAYVPEVTVDYHFSR